MTKMRVTILILATIGYGSFTLKPVEVVYCEEEDLTRFKSKTFKTEIRGEGI